MANELKIIVRFDTQQATAHVEALRKPIQAVKVDLDNLSKSQVVAQSAMTQTTRVSANAGMTLQALNYTIRDSPYFFRDFSLGILAIGNNLNPLIDGLIRMNIEAKAANQTLGSTLLNSLKGSAGLIFAFSILVSVLQAVTFAMAKTKSGAKHLTDEIEILKGVIKELIEFENPFEKWAFPIKAKDVDKMIEATDNEIKRLKEKKDLSDAYAFMVKLEYRDKIKITEDDKKKLELNEELIKVLEEQKLKLEAQKIVAERLKELGVEPQQDAEKEKNKTVEKEKQYIKTDAQLKAELAILQVLQRQTQSVRERLEYESMIKDIQFQLGLSERMSGDITAGGAMGFDILRLGTKGAKKGQGFIDPLGLSIEAKEAMQKAKEAQDVFLKQSVKTATDQLQLMQQVGKSVGDSIYDAFMHGKQGVDEFIKSLLIAIGRVLFLNWLEGGITSLFTPMPTVGSTPSLLPSIPRPSMQSSTQSVTSRLDAMNLNMMNNQPVVYIYADTDAVKFTRQKTNPAQDRLSKGNIINVV